MLNDIKDMQNHHNESHSSSYDKRTVVFKKITQGAEAHKVILIVAIALVVGFAIYAIFLRSSIISINIGANNTITNNIVTNTNLNSNNAPAAPKTTSTPTAKPTSTPTASPKPTSTPTKTPKAASTPEPGFFQRIGAWFGWLFTQWLPQAIVDVLKFIVVDVIWNFLIKTVLWGIVQFIWNLLVAGWHAIFG